MNFKVRGEGTRPKANVRVPTLAEERGDTHPLLPAGSFAEKLDQRLHKVTFLRRVEVELQSSRDEVGMGDMGRDLDETTAEFPAYLATRSHADGLTQLHQHTGIADIFGLTTYSPCHQAKFQRVLKA